MDSTAVVIIGASGGIGSYLMSELKEYQTIGTYNSQNPFQSDWGNVYRERTGGQEPQMYQLDVLQTNKVRSLVDMILPSRIVLVNAMGISRDGMAHNLFLGDWDEVLDVNLRGAFVTCQAFLPRMREEGWGRIINLCSIVGQNGIPGTSAYAASKAGLEGLTRTLASENAKKGITVNALALGYFNVGMINTIPHGIAEKIKAAIPMGHFGHPRNVAAAIRFLIGADYVTGTTININGGLP